MIPRSLLLGVALATTLRAGPPTPAPEHALVVLMTDYGTKDFYAGALKGAVYSACPRARVDMITHEVTEFDIQEGAYTLLQAAREFPAGTVFVASVDPGVGGVRRAVALGTPGGLCFVGPDNGIFTLVAQELGVAWAREISNPAVMRRGPRSKTFLGRDVFGPAAGALACGVPPETCGPPAGELVRLPITPLSATATEIRGGVLVADHYGNLITNIPEGVLTKGGLAPGRTLSITVGERAMEIPFVSTYSEVPQGKPLALIASAGYLELAINMGNLASQVGAWRNATVRIRIAGN